MAYGFYITQRGLEKITEASNTEGKVVINQYLVGDGGDLEGERDPGISQLGNELYRKSLTDVDSFEISGTKIMIKTVLPDEVPAMTFNEAGYLDTDDELIIYGTFKPITKNASNPEAPQIIEHDNYVEFTANQIDHVTIQTGNETLDSIVERVGALETGVENLKTTKADRTDLEALKEKIQTLETTLNKVLPKITVRCASKYEGKTITFNHNDETITEKVVNGRCTITVQDSGIWTITNSLDNQTLTVSVSEAFKKYVLEFGPLVYGVRVTKNEPDPDKRVVYTDDAVYMTPIRMNGSFGRANLNDWEDSWIFEKFYPVMLKTNGEEDYKLDPNDLTKKKEGGNSDIANWNYAGNAMVRINKFYSKYSSDDTYEYYQICDEPLEGFKPIGFIRDDGTESDRFYTACYVGGNIYSSTMRSISDQYFNGSLIPEEALTNAQKNGENYSFEIYSQKTITNILFLILCKSDNCQTAIGEGRGSRANGYTSKTGVTNSIGPIGCDETTGAVTFMWMEDYWFKNEYARRHLLGIIYNYNKLYIKMSGPYSFSDFSKYTEIKDAYIGKRSYIKSSIADNKFGRVPTEVGGTEDTYQCDSVTSKDTFYSEDAIHIAGYGRGGISTIEPLYTDAHDASAYYALTYIPPK